MRSQWVKVIMKNTRPYYVKIESPTFIEAIPWVAECLEKQGISSDTIDKYTLVTRPGRAPKNRIFYYDKPEGETPYLRICGACKSLVPRETNLCIRCGNIFNTRLLELTNNGST